MTSDEIPANQTVLNTTVLSNFAYIDQLWVVAGLSGNCTVPAVREELEDRIGELIEFKSGSQFHTHAGGMP